MIARSMILLDVLANASGPVTLTDLTHVTGLPLTTVHRLCADLLTERVIERAESGGLQIGSRLWDLGRRYARAERLRAAAGRYLHDLYEVTRSTVELAQVMAEGIAVIERIAAPNAALFDLRGSLEHVECEGSAAGIAILASSRRIRAEIRPAVAATGTTDLEEAIREAYATGIARRRDGDGFILSAAIADHAGPVGAVSVYAAGEPDVRAFGPSLLVTARRISTALVSVREPR